MGSLRLWRKLDRRWENLNSLTDAFNKILSFGTDTNININFDNVNISSGAPKLTKGCELTLKGTYTSAFEAFIIGSDDTFIIHNEADITTKSYVIGRSSAPESTVIFEQSGGTVGVSRWLFICMKMM